MGMEKDKPIKIGQNTLLVYLSVSLRQGFGCTFPMIGFCDEGWWRGLKCFGCVNFEHTNVYLLCPPFLCLCFFHGEGQSIKSLWWKMLKTPQMFWLCQLRGCKSMASTTPTFCLWLLIINKVIVMRHAKGK